MWELIRANERKSLLLFLCMGMCLLLLGYVIGYALFPPEGGMFGVLIAVALWFALSLLSYFSGDSILLSISRAKAVTRNVHPQLFNVVEEMKIAASLPVMPRICIIDDRSPNAFATGRNPQNSAIAVTAGLLSRLNRDELQGVIAHEMSHVMNRDVLYVTFAGVMLGSIVMISELFLKGIRHSLGVSRRFRACSSSGGGGAVQVVVFLVAIVFSALAPILARILYFALSRKREYLADASAVRLTRYPLGLAAALEKISQSSASLLYTNSVTASMFIANPLRSDYFASASLFSTHPPTRERIRILQGMQHGVNYKDYAKSLAKTKQQASSIFPPSALGDTKVIPIRKGTVSEPAPESAKAGARSVGDLMRAVNDYAFLVCACGLKTKVPPKFNREKISCPRCARELTVPLSNLKTAAAVFGSLKAHKEIDKKQAKKIAEKAGPQQYQRKGKVWESFACSCGRMIQLSPHFLGTHLFCPLCESKIEIKN